MELSESCEGQGVGNPIKLASHYCVLDTLPTTMPPTYIRADAVNHASVYI